MYNVRQLNSLILMAAVKMWEVRNNQQQQQNMAVQVKNTVKAIRRNANNLFARVENCLPGGYNKEQLKKRYIKQKIKQLKKMAKLSINNNKAPYNIVSKTN